MFLRFALLVVLCVVVRADNPSVGRVGQSVNGLASLDFKSSATAHQALLKLIKQVDLKLPTDLKAIADDETTELEGDNNQLQHAGDYFIECHPTPIAKDEKSKKECEVWKDSLKSWPKFAKFIRLLDAPDEVDPKVSARHEKIAEQLHFKLHPNEKPQLEESDNAAEKAEAKAANQGQAGSGSLLQTEESLPLFERPENNGRWPKDRNVYPIAFCFARHTRAYQKAFFYKAMRLVRAVANNIRFRQVGCGAPGHKIKMLYSKGDCGTEASGYKGAGNPTAGTARARGKPSTSQYLECDRNFYNTWSGAHELFHALGFGHTQSRAGRDRYLDIRRRGDGGSADWQYRKIGNNRGLFDFDSVMLYPADSPGDPKPTAWPRNPTPIGYAGNPANMGQRSYISAEDARILNMVYN